MDKEFRDPVHGFIKADPDEMGVIDTPAFQRLRNIHQLATTFLVYPGANHTRFEHSIGVMHLSGLIFDELMEKRDLPRYLAEAEVPKDEEPQDYYRKALRLASLIHDLGHPPFSHPGERLMPELDKVKDREGKSLKAHHEHYTVAIALNSEIRERVGNDSLLKMALNIAVKQEHLREALQELGEPWENWQDRSRINMILNEILTGDLGTDRIDYLLRDSLYTGTKYGIFDHLRLMKTMRIVPAEAGFGEDASIGIETGGLHVAEAMLLSRYHISLQVYYHKTRRILDHHYSEFLREILEEEDTGHFPPPTDVGEYLKYDDLKVLGMFNKEERDTKDWRRLFARQHFKMVDSTPLMIMDRDENRDRLEKFREQLNRNYDFDKIEENKKYIDEDVKIETKTSFALYDEFEQVSSEHKRWHSVGTYSTILRSESIANLNVTMQRAYVDREVYEEIKRRKGGSS